MHRITRNHTNSGDKLLKGSAFKCRVRQQQHGFEFLGEQVARRVLHVTIRTQELKHGY